MEVFPAFGHEERRGFHRCFAEEVPLTEAEEQELEALQAERDGLTDQQCDEEADEENPEVAARLEAIDAAVEALTDRPGHWTPEVMARAGAVVTLSSTGTVIVERGLIRPEDASGGDDTLPDDGDDQAEAPAATLPSTLIARLTAERTAALRTTLAQQPDIALAAVVHTLTRAAFYTYGGESCLDISAKHRAFAPSLQPDEFSGVWTLDAERGRWAERLPSDADDLFAWCLLQTQDTLLDLLAVAAAHTVDAVREKGVHEDAPRLMHSDALANALGFDMHTWFTPTAENYFGRVNRTFILDAMAEAGVPARTRSWSKLKKGELAVLAERETSGTGWLPHPLRNRSDSVKPDEAQDSMPAAAAA